MGNARGAEGDDKTKWLYVPEQFRWRRRKSSEKVSFPTAGWDHYFKGMLANAFCWTCRLGYSPSPPPHSKQRGEDTTKTEYVLWVETSMAWFGEEVLPVSVERAERRNRAECCDTSGCCKASHKRTSGGQLSQLASVSLLQAELKTARSQVWFVVLGLKHRNWMHWQRVLIAPGPKVWKANGTFPTPGKWDFL